MTAVTEACQPYELRHDDSEPVNIWRLLDRLTDEELRDLAMAFSVWAPALFEDKLRRLWAERA